MRFEKKDFIYSILWIVTGIVSLILSFLATKNSKYLDYAWIFFLAFTYLRSNFLKKSENYQIFYFTYHIIGILFIFNFTKIVSNLTTTKTNLIILLPFILLVSYIFIFIFFYYNLLKNFNKFNFKTSYPFYFLNIWYSITFVFFLWGKYIESLVVISLAFLFFSTILTFREIVYKKNFWECFTGISLILGITGIFILIYKIGPKSIGEEIKKLSLYKFFLLSIWYLVVYIFDTFSWKKCFLENTTGLSFWKLFKSQLAGATVNILTPSGNLGEPVKVALIKDNIDSKKAMSALLIWNIIHNIITASIIVMFSFFLLFSFKIKLWIIGLQFLAALICSIPTILIILSIFKNWLSKITKLLKIIKMKEEKILIIYCYIKDVEENIKTFIKNNPKNFLIAVFFLIFSRFTTISVAYGVMWALSIKVSCFSFFFIAISNLTVGIVFSFIPNRIGILEMYNTYIFTLFNFSSSSGLAFPIVNRILQLVIIILGTIFLFDYQLRKDKIK